MKNKFINKLVTLMLSIVVVFAVTVAITSTWLGLVRLMNANASMGINIKITDAQGYGNFQFPQNLIVLPGEDVAISVGVKVVNSEAALYLRIRATLTVGNEVFVCKNNIPGFVTESDSWSYYKTDELTVLYNNDFVCMQNASVQIPIELNNSHLGKVLEFKILAEVMPVVNGVSSNNWTQIYG